MKKKLVVITGLYSILLLGTSCANVISPSGGDRDSLPPVLLKSTPRDSALHFSENKITLYFNEFVKIENPQQNIIVLPLSGKPPLITSKLGTVTVRLKDSPEANTTYSINFGNSIRDINEGNIAEQFTYTFSTGSFIDSGSLAGKIVLAETGKIDSTLIVVLHRNLTDTAVAKLSPRYYAKLDGKGRFVFRNLPTDTFAIYAMPNDYNKKYDDSTKMFAFANDPVVVKSTTDSLTLYAYQEEKEKLKTAPVKKEKGKKKEEEKFIKIMPNNTGLQDILGDMAFTLSKPIKSFDSSKFTLYDTSYTLAGKMNITIDTSFTRLTAKYKWPENTHFILLIEKNAVVDSSGVTLAKNDTIKFQTKKESDYGSLRLRFMNMAPEKNYVLQIYQNEQLHRSIPIVQKVWQTKLFHPGEYELRVLEDRNNNGIWDPGRFFTEKKQPEKVIFLPRKLTVRVNWENEADVSL